MFLNLSERRVYNCSFYSGHESNQNLVLIFILPILLISKVSFINTCIFHFLWWTVKFFGVLKKKKKHGKY